MYIRRVGSRPSEHDFAINRSPNESTVGGWIIHFGSVIGGHHQYWESIEAAATEQVDIARQKIAHDIVGCFRSASGRVGELVDSIESGAPLSPELQNDIRRKTLGVLGVSSFISNVMVQNRLFPSRFDESVQIGDAVGGQVSPDFVLDMDSDERGTPLDYRIHLPREIGESIFPKAPGLDAWYFGKGSMGDCEVPRMPPDGYEDYHAHSIWMHRTPADLSDGLKLYLLEHGVAMPTDTVTVFPYINQMPQPL